MNHVRILDDPSNTFLKGDIVGYNTFRADINKRVQQVPLKDALGEVLGKEYFHFSVGTRIIPSVAHYLKQQGVKEVMIAPRAPSVEFVMKPLTSIPTLHPDWLARMAHRGLKPAILRAAHMGDVSNLHGTHPVPAYAFGVEFGKGEKGRY